MVPGRNTVCSRHGRAHLEVRPTSTRRVDGRFGDEVVASVSGGCVEGAVYELAQDVIRSGQPRLVSFGVSDEDALTIGLTCGGVIEIFIDRIDA